MVYDHKENDILQGRKVKARRTIKNRIDRAREHRCVGPKELRTQEKLTPSLEYRVPEKREVIILQTRSATDGGKFEQMKFDDGVIEKRLTRRRNLKDLSIDKGKAVLLSK